MQEILIVEDDRAQARLMARLVERGGYASRVVHDGTHALRAIREAPPAAVVLDLLLPGMSGEAVLAALQADPVHAGLPVIAVSALFRGAETAERLVEAGARAFLRKPFDGDALLDELGTSLGPTGSRAAGVSTIDLAHVPVPEVIWGAVERELTGALHFARARVRKSLLLERGQPRAVRSNVRSETLGARLQTAGRIDREAALASSRRACERGELQGQVLVEMGLIEPRELEREIDLQAAHKLMELFTWSEGLTCEQPGVRGLAMATPLEGWTSERLLTRGVKLMHAESVARVLEPYEEFIAIPDDDETLTAVDTLLRQKLCGGVRVSEVEPGQRPSLYAAWRVGRLRLDVPRASAPAPRGESADLARKLAGLLARQREQDLFEVLQLELDATPDQVREAHARLSAAWAPSTVRDQPPRVRALAGALRARIDLARTVLCDPAAASAYARRARARALDPGGSASITEEVCAEAELQRGRALLDGGDPARAEPVLRRALALAPDDTELICIHAWCAYLAGPGAPGAAAQARERMDKAAALDPDADAPPSWRARLEAAIASGTDRAAS